MKAVHIFFAAVFVSILLGCVTNEPLPVADNAIPSKEFLENKKAKASLLLMKKEVVLSGITVGGGGYHVRLYPQKGSFHAQLKHTCFPGELLAQFSVNNLGNFMMESSAKAGIIAGCPRLRIVVNPNNLFVSEYIYNETTSKWEAQRQMRFVSAE